MVQRHFLTKDYNNLRGVSTDTIFQRPPYVAEIAENMVRNPNDSLGSRRGFSPQAAKIGGLGFGSFKNPLIPQERPVVLHTDGNLYLLGQRFLNIYNDGVQATTSTGTVAGPNFVIPVNSTANLLIGNQIQFVDSSGVSYVRTIINIVGLNVTIDSDGPPVTVLNNAPINVVNVMDINIFVDPRFLASNVGWSFDPWSTSPWGAQTGETITIDIDKRNAVNFIGGTGVSTIIGSTEYWSYQVSNNFLLQVGNKLVVVDNLGNTNTLNIIQIPDATHVVLDGPQLTIAANTLGNVLFEMFFLRGIDEASPILLSDFINAVTGSTGLLGLQQSIGGPSNVPAAFLDLLETTIVEPMGLIELPYEYWIKLNNTVSASFPGSANLSNQNSPDFQIASIETFDNALYIANGYDPVGKFDGQTVYKAGMPEGMRPPPGTTAVGSLTGYYQYIVTYEQVDAAGHIIEGAASQPLLTSNLANNTYTFDIQNLLPNSGWNTDSGTFVAGGDISPFTGPDANGNYYFTIPMSHSFKIGDTAFYLDQKVAQVNLDQSNVGVVNVVNLPNQLHQAIPGMILFYSDGTNGPYQRQVIDTTPTQIDLSIGNIQDTNQAGVTVKNGNFFQGNVQNPVFGNIGIVSGNQSNTNSINVQATPTIQHGDFITFTDTSGVFQRRQVTSADNTSPVVISGIPVSVSDGTVLQSETIRSNQITVQRNSSQVIGLKANQIFSNNLRINVYRTSGASSATALDENFTLVATLSNDGQSGAATQPFTDVLPDTEQKFLSLFEFPDEIVASPPVCKYLLPYRNIMLYAGGNRGTGIDLDKVFFSDPNFPETVPPATNFFKVSPDNDPITGLGVANTTLVIFKLSQIYPIIGDIVTRQYEANPVAPDKNIGCVSHFTIKSVGHLLYFLHTNGLYSMTDTQLFPIDPFGSPVPLSRTIDQIFRSKPFLPDHRFILTQAVAINYSKDLQYLLYLPCQDPGVSENAANANSRILCYDYKGKDWFIWDNINAAGGFIVINDDLFWNERRFSSVLGNTSDTYKQHRFYRLIDYADHTSAQIVEWRSSWEDMGAPNVRKKFIRCVMEFDRENAQFQSNIPTLKFSSFVDRIPNLTSTQATVTQEFNTASGWSFAPWSYVQWDGYQDSFIRVNLRGGTATKALQIGWVLNQLNTTVDFCGFQLEVSPDFRKTIVR